MTKLTAKTHRLTFGARVRELRLERRLTQEQLAQKSRRNPAYVGGVERGERNPTLDMIHSLAEGLGVDVVELFRPASAGGAAAGLRAAAEERGRYDAG